MDNNDYIRIDKVIMIFFILTFIILGTFFLKISASVMAPLIFAIMLSFMFYPIMLYLEKFRIPRLLAIIMILSFIIVMLYFIFLIFQASFGIFINDYSRYLNQFRDIYHDITAKIMTKFNLKEGPDFLLGYDWGALIKDYILKFSNSLSKILSYTGLIFLFMFFLFLEYPYIVKKIYFAFSFKGAKKFTIITQRILQLVGRYFLIKFIISFFTGMEVWIVLHFTGVDFSLLWGVMAFIMNFIPTVGSILVVIFISIQGFVQFYPNIGMVLLVFLLNVGIQQLMGNIIEPRIQGNSLNLSPVLILIALALWTWIWGPLGAVMAVPITVVLRVVCFYFKPVKFISVLMGTGHNKKN